MKTKKMVVWNKLYLTERWFNMEYGFRIEVSELKSYLK